MVFNEHVVDNWLKRNIDQTSPGSTEKDRSDDWSLNKRVSDEFKIMFFKELTYVLTKSRCPQVCALRWFGQPTASTHPHLLKEGEVTLGISKAEYKSRRTHLVTLARESFKQVKSVKNHIIIFPSATKLHMSSDIPYHFRQNSDFLYLTGFQEPDSLLVLHTTEDGSTDYRSVLFVPKKDPMKELWDGPRSGIDGAWWLTGVEEVHNSDEIEMYFSDICKRMDNFGLWYSYMKPVHREFDMTVLKQFIKEKQHRFLESTVLLCHHLRVIKSQAEIDLMAKSVQVASDAFAEVMKFSYPGIKESYLHAKMDFECRMRDAQFLAYPPVVAGGNRANTIHYIINNQIIEDGELVLMDAGCEYFGYTSDITRTWPVSGKFNPAQRAVYDAVLFVQEVCIALCTTKYSLDDIYREMLEIIGQQLKKLGIISSHLNTLETLKASREFCPHHVSHYLGMDVHDTHEIPRSIKLQPGMVVTIEPGIYIPETNTSVPKEYRGIGIRIEDNVLITESEPVVLSADCPKTPEHIEHIMRR